MPALSAYVGLEPALDVGVHWLAYALHQTLSESGYALHEDKPRAGLIMGNLGYPTQGLTDLTATFLLDKGAISQPVNRFNTALPLHHAARHFGLRGTCFALEAACASALYAIKHACDRLHSGEADLMLAGGLNASDFLCLHTGFSALNALSYSGYSRPFSQAADGLIPTQGVALVALKRLEDAEADGDKILGVIRGIGLSNDGRDGSFLSPSAVGQLRALRQAYAQADLSPQDISYIECHATGTRLGDATEIQALADLYADAAQRPALGALKANIGHSITVSGAAGLLKVLGMMEHNCLPATPQVQPLNAVFEQADFEVVQENRVWTGVQRAGISSFGFGGNNAHLIVEAYESHAEPQRRGDLHNVNLSGFPKPISFAIVGIEVQTHHSQNFREFQRQLQQAPEQVRQAPVIDHIDLSKAELIFPPADLHGALAQQVWFSHTAMQALRGVAFESEHTGVFVGMQCDTIVARYYARTRLPALLQARGIEPDATQLDSARDVVSEATYSAQVLGSMANITANRLNYLLSAQGTGYALFAEELSGDVALDAALRALADGEVSTALVGAVDLCREPVHLAAARAMLPSGADGGDAALVLVVKTLEQALADRDTVLAEIALLEAADGFVSHSAAHSAVQARFGHAHAAQGLLNVAAALAQGDATQVENHSITGQGYAWQVSPYGENLCAFAALRELKSKNLCASAPLHETSFDTQHRLLRAFAADSHADLQALLQKKQRQYPLVSGSGAVRAVLLGDSEAALDATQQQLAERLQQPDSVGWCLPNAVVHERMDGELAFVFTGAAAAYEDAGLALHQAFPMLMERIKARKAQDWPGDVLRQRDDNQAFNQLKISAWCSGIHAALSLELLDLQPDAALGLSSGESNALFSLDAWTDMRQMLADIEQSGLYTEHLAGEYQVVRAYWKEEAKPDFANYLLFADPAQVQAALGDMPRVYLSVINTDAECLIAGERAQCEAVLRKLPTVKALPLDFDLCCHCAAVEPFREAWYAVHQRAVSTSPVRFYANHQGGAYPKLDSDSIATALTGQALNTVDFPRTVRQAWQDGVRIFLEHGPRQQLTGNIGKILAGQPHMALALDATQAPVTQVYWVAAELWAAGVDVDLAALQRQAQRALRWVAPEDSALRVALRRPLRDLGFLQPKAAATQLKTPPPLR